MSLKYNTSKSKVTDKIFIGIDQSITHSGVTILKKENNKILILDSFGISTNTKLTFEERLLTIERIIFEKIKLFNNEELSVGVEGLAYNRNNTNNTSMLFGLFSLIITRLCLFNIRYSIITPNSLKKFATGYGHSTKEEMIDQIGEEFLNILLRKSNIKNIRSKKFEDISDSFWLAMFKLNESET